MPGEQLTCVIHLAFEKYGGSSLHRSSIYTVFTTVNCYKCLCFTKTEFFCEITENVKFPQLKKFILSKRKNEITEREIQDKIEKACWDLAKDFYPKCPFRMSEVYKLWLVFNRVADEGTYPPVITESYADWIIDKFMSIANLSEKKARGKISLTFRDFLCRLEHSFNADSIVPVTKKIHDWLVKEVIKADWVYTKIKRRGNWSLWERNWMNISPGKLQILRRKSDLSIVIPKCVFYICQDMQIQIDESKQTGMANVIRVSNARVFDCLVAVTNKQELESWLQALNQSLKYYLEETSPIRVILAQQPRDVIKPTLNSCILKCEESFMQYEVEKAETNKSKKARKEETQQTVRKGCLLRLNSVNSEKEKIKAVFLDFDKDGNGFLEQKEFEMALKEIGFNLKESECTEIFSQIDADGNGRIMFNEFYDYFLENIVCSTKSVFCQEFEGADKKRKGVIDFKEFSEFIRAKHGSVTLDKLLSCFDKLCGKVDKDELSWEDFQSMSVFNELGPFPSNFGNFKALLKSRFDTCDTHDLKDKIRKRWNKFASFRRPGESGKIAMAGASGIVDDLVPGEYSLKDLVEFRDLPAILPKRAVVENVSWESSNIPDTSGNLVFPSEFNGVIEVETATNALLAYYGCKFAEDKSEKVYLPYRHAIQDFTYENDYLTNYVEKKNKGAGLERHDFIHLDCPLTDESGIFILGKFIEDELHITAFRIPKRHTLYIPGNCIHSNDYLRGTWRTMLSDESNIDHVYLKRKRKGKEEKLEDIYLDPLTFQFCY